MVTVELTPHRYIPLRETLFHPSCLLFTVTVTRNDSNYFNRSASLKRFSWIIFHHQWIGRQNTKLQIKCIPEMHLIILGYPEWLRRRLFTKNMHRRPDFSWKKMHHRQDLSNKMRRRPDFLTQSWWVLCPIDMVCNWFSTNHSSDSSSFNQSINSLIN